MELRVLSQSKITNFSAGPFMERKIEQKITKQAKQNEGGDLAGSKARLTVNILRRSG
jgi:hypothetical protein